jgi:V/A-type H+-transporting ATPase subunit C
MSQEFLFISGQIRALEDKLLSVNRMDRMIGAKDASHAFRVLTEMQYAQYIDETVTPKDFLTIIQKGLQETKTFLQKGTDEAQELNAIWWNFDSNNIKRALKTQFAGTAAQVDTLSEEAGYSALATGSVAELNHLVFGTEISEDFEMVLMPFVEAIKTSKALLETATAGDDAALKKMETIIDKAYYAAVKTMAKKTSNKFLKKYIKKAVTAANIRTLTRTILVLNESVSSDQYIPFSDIKESEFTGVENREALIELLISKEDLGFDALYRASMTDTQILQMVEKQLDSLYQTFLKEADADSIGSVEIPFTYFERRFHNAKMLKYIMYAKFHGMTSERIYETVHTFDLINVK